MKLKERFLRLAFLLMAVFAIQITAYGQAPEEDVVYLKDGSILRGRVIEQKPGEYLKIEIMGGSVFVFQSDEIDLITKEPMKLSSLKLKKPKKYRPLTFRQRGMYNQVSFSLQWGQSRWGGVEAYPTLHYRAGYHFNHYAQLGLGLGIDAYEAGGIVPLYLDFQGTLTEKKFSPYYFASAGYGFGVSEAWSIEELNGGPMGHIGAGWKLNTRNRTAWIFDLGYKVQHTNQTRFDWWFGPGNGATLEGTRTYQKVVFRTTLEF